jgi:hypothetical protein
VWAKSRYADIQSKVGRGGNNNIFVTIDTEYRNGRGRLLVVAREVLVWR